MKKCTICKVEKVETDFNRNQQKKDGLQTICRECSAKRSRRYYQEKTQSHREVTKRRRNEKRKQIKEKIDAIKAMLGCRKCGEKDVVCLDFHHADPNEKDFEVARATSYEWTWEKILGEIDKCVCLCASCHRKVHAGRFKITPDMIGRGCKGCIQP